VKTFFRQLQIISKLPEIDDSQISWLEKVGEDETNSFRKIYDKSKSLFMIIKSCKCIQDTNENLKRLEQLIFEDELLQKVERIRWKIPDFFLKYYGIYRNSQNSQKQDALIKTESWHATLDNVLQAGKVYNCAELLQFLPNLVEGFSILQENGIAHRDVKPNNILLVENEFKENGEYSYKISNFGFGCYVSNGESKTNTESLKGNSRLYAAPEVLQIIDQNLKADYNPFLADVYSLGWVILKMINRTWEEKDLKEGLLANKEALNGYEDILEMLQGMLEETIDKRWSFKKILDYLKANEEKFQIKSKAPADEAHFCQKWHSEFKEKNEETTKEGIEKVFLEHRNLYLSYTELTRPKEAKYHLDCAWVNLEKWSQIFKDEGKNQLENGDITLLEREIFCHNAFGEWYTSMGNFSLAEQNLEKSMIKLKIWQEKGSQGKENDKVIKKMEGTAFMLLGNLYLSKGNLNNAEECYDKSLKIHEDLFGDKHADVATSFNKLGILYYNMGNISKAEEFYLKALRIRLMVFGENHSEVASSLNNLAQLNFHQGNYPEAEGMYLKSLKVFQNLFGENHSKVAISYNNLGLLYDHMGDLAKAEQFYLHCLKIRQNLFTEDHSEVATLYNNLGVLYDNMEQPEKSEEFYLKALNILMNIFGENSLDVADLHNNLGVLENSMGNLTKAEEFYLKSLKTRQNILGDNHINVSNSLNNLASLYHKLENFAKAEEFYLQCLKIRQNVLGENNIEVAESLYSLSLTYEVLGNMKDAYEYAEKAYKIAKSIVGENNEKTIAYSDHMKKLDDKIENK